MSAEPLQRSQPSESAVIIHPPPLPPPFTPSPSRRTSKLLICLTPECLAELKVIAKRTGHKPGKVARLMIEMGVELNSDKKDKKNKEEGQ